MSRALGRRLSSLLLLFILAASPLLAGQTWRSPRVDNVEIVSNLSERDLRHLHRQIHYFNRTMETLFGKRYVQYGEPIEALLVRSERELRNFVGDQARHQAGSYRSVPGMEMLLARNIREDNYTQRILFHELTHRNVAPVNPPLWLNEGVAELFETLNVTKRGVIFGAASPGWVTYLRDSPIYHKVSFEQFFNMRQSHDHYRDGKKSAHFYATAWIFAHYCWFGDPSLRPRYLELGSRRHVDEATFEDVFGFNYSELADRLRRYTRSGRYSIVEIPLDHLEPPGTPEIQVVGPEVWKNFHARAHLLSANLSKARDLAASFGPGDEGRLRAVETLYILSLLEKHPTESARYLAEARSLGTQNGLLLAAIIDERLAPFKAMSRNDVPVLPQEQAAAFMAELLPKLRMHRRTPWIVRTTMTLFDLSEASVPEPMNRIFEIWEETHGQTDPEGRAVLSRIRARQQRAADSR